MEIHTMQYRSRECSLCLKKHFQVYVLLKMDFISAFNYVQSDISVQIESGAILFIYSTGIIQLFYFLKLLVLCVLLHCRRSPLATYVSMEAVYCLYYAFKSRGIVTPLPHGEVRRTGV